MKLYWRYKKAGAWTWKAAVLAEDLEGEYSDICCIKPMEEEE